MAWRVVKRGEKGDPNRFREEFTDWMALHEQTHLPFIIESDGRRRSDSKGGGRWLDLRARCLQHVRPPLEVVQRDIQAHLGYGIDRLAAFVERATWGMITAVRSGTISASTAIWARCSMARTPPSNLSL
jgi:hypothetical protein